MFANLASRDRILLLITIGLLMVEFVGMYLFSMTGKKQRVRRYLSLGGRARAHKVSEKIEKGKVLASYAYQYDKQEYILEISVKRPPEMIEVYFDPQQADRAITLADVPRYRKILPLAFPAVITLFIAIAYKILYR